MRILLLSLIFLFIAGIAQAGQVSTLTPDEVVKLVRDHKLDGLKKVWKELDIKSKLFKYIDPENVERFEGEIDGSEGVEALIMISSFGRAQWQYLVFSKRMNNWFFLGNIDLYTGVTPLYRIIKWGDDVGWLVITSRDVWGTEISLFTEHWWDLSGDKLKKVLEYPTLGYAKGWGMVFDRKLISRIWSFMKHPDNKFYVYVDFWAIYYDGLNRHERLWENILFAITNAVYYMWDPSKGRFVIDQNLSDMTQEEIDGLFNDGNDRFLKHNFEEIKKLASSKEESKREWLKRFLQDCSDSPEKTALLDLLH